MSNAIFLVLILAVIAVTAVIVLIVLLVRNRGVKPVSGAQKRDTPERANNKPFNIDDYIVPYRDLSQGKKSAAPQRRELMETQTVGLPITDGADTLNDEAITAPKYVIRYKKDGMDKYYESQNRALVIIGRDLAWSDLVIDDDMKISGQHAMVYYKNGKICLADLCSKNGTYIGGENGGSRLYGPKVIDGQLNFRVGGTEMVITLS